MTDDDIDKLIAEAIADTPPDAQKIKEVEKIPDEQNKENVIIPQKP